MKLLVSIILGAIIGWAANKIMKGDSSSFLRNIIIGIIGSFLAGLLGLHTGWLGSLLLSIGGACLCIFVGRRLFSNEIVKK